MNGEFLHAQIRILSLEMQHNKFGIYKGYYHIEPSHEILNPSLKVISLHIIFIYVP